jgi:hypothetical protein
MAFIYDLTDTWNAGGTSFNGIKMNVTDTASAAASRLMTLQVGGAERFSVRKDGQGYFAGNVGIGTATPGTGTRLNVAGRGLFTGGAVDPFDGTASGVSISYDTVNNIGNVVAVQTGVSERQLNIAANPITFRTAGTERARITAAGDVGIGTSSPGYKLDIAGSDAAFRATSDNAYGDFTNGTATLRSQVSGPDGFLGTVNAGSLVLRTGNAERMRVTATGDVGIGTSSPQNGGGFARVVSIFDANAPALSIGNSSRHYQWGVAPSISNGLGLYDGTASAYRMLIDASGNVGIGATSPDAKLNVVGTVAIGFPGASSNTFGQRFWPTVAGNSVFNIYADISQMRFTTGASNDHTANTSLMVLTNFGSVGIGTLAPQTPFGGRALQLGNTSDTTSVFTLQSSTVGSLYFSDGTTGGDTYVGYLQYNHTENSMAFGTGTNERMRITAAGDVGIGTASPTGSRVQIRGANNLVAAYADGLKVTSNNESVSCEYNWTGINASSNLLLATGGTERARIDAGGNLLVGTTTQTNFSKLTVYHASASNNGIASVTDTTGFKNHFSINNPNGEVGYISSDGTTTTYSTSSDARLKHDIVDAPEASGLIDAIKVRSFKWNADDSEQRYGFVAQELIEVAPEAVGVPANEDQMMGVDYSKLVPMLVKEIQSLRARVAQLEGN